MGFEVVGPAVGLGVVAPGVGFWLVATAADLFKVVGSGAVKIPINQKYSLKDAAKAHKEMEGRDTTGSTILMP